MIVLTYISTGEELDLILYKMIFLNKHIRYVASLDSSTHRRLVFSSRSGKAVEGRVYYLCHYCYCWQAMTAGGRWQWNREMHHHFGWETIHFICSWQKTPGEWTHCFYEVCKIRRLLWLKLVNLLKTMLVKNVLLLINYYKNGCLCSSHNYLEVEHFAYKIKNPFY